MSEDFPTLERPMNANSGSFRAGFCSTRVLLPENMAVLTFMDPRWIARTKIGNYFDNFGYRTVKQAPPREKDFE